MTPTTGWVRDAAALGFWACTSLVLYSYAAYPVIIWVLSRTFGARLAAPAGDGDGDGLPTASLLLAAYNEESVISDRLANALAMDYPADRIEVLVGSDGSRDRTSEIVRTFSDPRIRLHDYDRNRGKAAVLNALADAARGEILLMSDANTHIDPAAARRLVRWFRRPDVGSVVGRLVLVDPRTGRNADGLYWEYETFLKGCEARLGALLGANGAIYAIRRELYAPIPAGTIVDDFLIPLLARLRTGCTLVYDAEAVAVEETPPDVGSEFHRRARIGAGGFQSVGMLWPLLDPRRGWTALAFLSHKLLRWLCPFFLIGALLCSALLRGDPPYRALLIAQVGFYAAATALAFVPTRARWMRPLRLATMFAGMNLALLVGFWRWISGRQGGAWRRTARGEAAAARHRVGPEVAGRPRSWALPANSDNPVNKL